MQRLAERGAVRRVVRRLDDAQAHPGRGGEHAVQPGRVDHLEDRPDAAALLADEPRVAPSYSTSAEALERLPSLSFSRIRRIPLRVPSGSTRGSRKQDRPWSGVCASTMNRSLIGAEVNHLWPVMR